MILRILSVWCFVCWSASAQQAITTANAHWPPWRTIESDGSLSGIEIDILKGLSARLELDLVTKGCGWKRCLKHMKMGESDLMSGLYKTAEREQYMAFVEPPYRSHQNTCFYLLHDSQLKINSYQDLKSLRIAVQSKVAYFERFDKDEQLFKHEVIDDIAAFRLLKGGRVDTLIMSCAEVDYFIKEQSISAWFKHANYVEQEHRPVYLAISKHSPLVQRKQELSKALQDMLDSGEVQSLLEQNKLLKRD
ncbi:hypothetical protein AHAT_30250 [Agarivorans sp. Toyoura001]|uniref:substrate-binding periplasmic protein n=1 Tax=Agarivorans sp. Toyoura001 TaxID=2283141 RepID=UPI0010DE3D26|nr:transporter substrate-binding domain-containing protein [Agarivorans sp. Toyoura001]GDY27135.1 hypothetical protein AHAT_30250 [Agarivorans sp. Toyoura001]